MNILSTRNKAALILAAGLVVLTVGVVVGRSRDAASNASVVDRSVGGAIVLAQPLPRPSFVLTTTDGQPYDFATETRGRTVLLYFGFLNCPDICPIHLSNIASALNDLTDEQRATVTTVFVTVDPGRDDPDEIRRFLDRFDPSFVGLTGSPADLAAAQRATGVAVAELGEPDTNGDYEVGHAAQVIAFGPDGPADRVYPSGSTVADWQRDLPLLVEGALG